MSSGIAILRRTIALGGARIDRYSYDQGGDVLYLMVGEPTGRPAEDTEDSLEGDTVFFGVDGRATGATLISPRRKLDRDGTLPSRGIAVRWPRELVEPLLVETLSYA